MTASPQDVTALLERLEDIELAQRREHAAYRQGYADGARGQYEEGYVAAIADVKHTWHQVVSAVQLTGRRLTPGGDIWLAAVARHGLTEYGGAGKPRVPLPPEVIAQACREQEGRAA
jgi:hypothetical protein